MNTPVDERNPGAKQQCPWYFECCRHWEINPETDLYCVRERNESVEFCTELRVTERRGDVALVTFTPGHQGEHPRELVGCILTKSA